MSIRALRYLLSVEETGSITAAAKEHFVTQPAVSIQLRRLQEDLGAVLFEIVGREVRFTEAGRRVLDYARRITALENEMAGEIKGMTGLLSGRVSIGTIDAASIYILPGVYSAFRRRYPGIELRVDVSSTAPLLERMLDGRLDIVVGTLSGDGNGEMVEREIFREEMVPIAPPGHPAAARKGIEVDVFAEHPFISFHRESVTRKMIEEALLQLGATLEVTMEIDSQEAIKNLVASGLGLSILPRHTVAGEIEKGALARSRVRGLRIERSIGLMVPRGRHISAAAKAFLDVMSEELDITLTELQEGAANG